VTFSESAWAWTTFIIIFSLVASIWRVTLCASGWLRFLCLSLKSFSLYDALAHGKLVALPSDVVNHQSQWLLISQISPPHKRVSITEGIKLVGCITLRCCQPSESMTINIPNKPPSLRASSWLVALPSDVVNHQSQWPLISQISPPHKRINSSGHQVGWWHYPQRLYIIRVSDYEGPVASWLHDPQWLWTGIKLTGCIGCHWPSKEVLVGRESHYDLRFIYEPVKEIWTRSRIHIWMIWALGWVSAFAVALYLPVPRAPSGYWR
jgi:hypothetical protein